MQQETNASGTRRVRVWDLPLRLFHWLLAAAVVTAFVAIWTDNLEVHVKAGYCILILLLFRLVWGFIGGTHARFLNFIKGPAAIRGYLAGKRTDPHSMGHNPLGALSVLALLVALLVQVATGLFNHSDDFFFDGPLYKFVSSDTYGRLAEVHEIVQWIILGLVALHIVAIVFYHFVKRDNLVRPMITGNKDVPADSAAPDSKGGGVLLGIVALTLAMAVVWYLTTRV